MTRKKKGQDYRLASVKSLIESGRIADLKFLFTALPKTVLADAARIKVTDFSHRLENPGDWSMKWLLRIAETLDISLFQTVSLFVGNSKISRGYFKYDRNRSRLDVNNDPRYDILRQNLLSGQILFFGDCFDYIPKYIFFQDIGFDHNKKYLQYPNNPELLTYRMVHHIAENIRVPINLILTLIWNEFLALKGIDISSNIPRVYRVSITLWNGHAPVILKQAKPLPPQLLNHYFKTVVNETYKEASVEKISIKRVLEPDIIAYKSKNNLV